MRTNLGKRLGGHFLREYLDRELLISNFWHNFSPDILSRRMLVVGVGGSGCNVALALARMGFQEITVVDRDKVEASNFTRQVLYGVDDVGREKAKVAGKRLKEHSLGSINAFQIDILAYRRKFDSLVRRADFVFGLVDSKGAQYFITERCVAHAKPMISGGTDPVTGLVTSFRYMGEHGHCEECIARSSVGAPPEWIAYYSGTEHTEKNESVKKFDEKLAHRAKCASTYITASTGANLMVSAMVGHYMGRQVPGLVIFNVLTMDIWKFFPVRWPDCTLCSKYISNAESSEK